MLALNNTFIPKNKEESSTYKKLVKNIHSITTKYQNGLFSEIVTICPKIIKKLKANFGNRAAVNLYECYTFYVKSYKNMGKFEKALEICRGELIDLIQANWHEQSEEYAVCMGDIVDIYYNLGKYVEASQLNKELTFLYKVLNGEGSRDHCSCLQVDAEIKGKESPTEAIKMIHHIFGIMKDKIVRDELTQTLNFSLADFYERLGNYNYTLKLKRCTINYYCALEVEYKKISVINPISTQLMECLSSLGSTLLKLKLFDDAINIFQAAKIKAYEIDILQINNKDVVTLQNLIDNCKHFKTHDSNCERCINDKIFDVFINADLSINFCVNCHTKLSKLNICSGCNDVYYCSNSCQKEHWSIHKLNCK